MIFGRGLLIVNENTNARYCAPIGFDRNEFKMVMARFGNEYIGSIILRQSLRSNESETMVEIDLRRAHTGVVANDMEYHVHTSALTDDDALNGNCVRAGGHFDPLVVDKRNYLSDCGSGSSPSDVSSGKGYQLFCELGDLSGKHGLLRFNNASHLRMTYVDLQLPLFGPLSVASKSIVIHQPVSGLPIACASLKPVVPRTSMVAFDTNQTKGIISLTQRSPYDPTIVTINVAGLNGQATALRVGEFALVPALEDRQCSQQSIGSTFNPFGVTPAASPASPDLDGVSHHCDVLESLNIAQNLTESHMLLIVTCL
jgi:hypothetical protein